MRVQRAMSVSQPGDPSETEADRVADAVMRMPSAPDVVLREAASVAREDVPEEEELLQAKRLDRLPAAREDVPLGDEEDKDEKVALQRVDADTVRREEPEEEEMLATKREASRSAAPVPDVENGGDVSPIVNQGLAGGGQLLDSASRAFFEPRLGQDLGNIRVHTGAQASQSAEQVSARAYAVGNNVAFRDGEYNPGTSAGRHLMAHELAHTVQQGATTPLARKPEPGAHRHRSEAVSRTADAVGGALVQRYEETAQVQGMGSRVNESSLIPFKDTFVPPAKAVSPITIRNGTGAVEGGPVPRLLPFAGRDEEVTLPEDVSSGKARFEFQEEVTVNNIVSDDHQSGAWRGEIPFTVVADQITFGNVIPSQTVFGKGATLTVNAVGNTTPNGGTATFSVTIAASGSLTAGGSIGVGPISASAPISATSNFVGGITRTFTIRLLTTPPKPIVAPDVSFGINSAKLTDGQEGVISGWFNGLSEANKSAIRNGKRAITLSGYASRTSGRKHNRDLSEQRAHVVERILRGHAGSGATINIFFFGEDNTPGQNEKENPQFRRATVQVQSPTNVAPGVPGK